MILADTRGSVEVSEETSACPYCAQIVGNSAIVCRHCQRHLPELAENKIASTTKNNQAPVPIVPIWPVEFADPTAIPLDRPLVPRPSKMPPYVNLIAIPCLLIILVCGFGLLSLYKDARASSPTIPHVVSTPSAVSQEDLKIEAMASAEQFVQSKIKMASTARFPSLEAITARQERGGVWCVQSYVDYQTGVNAMGRSDYAVKIKKTGKNWGLVSIAVMPRR